MIKGGIIQSVVSEDFIATHVNEENSFTVTTNLVTVSGVSEAAFLLLKNPSTSGIEFLVTHFVTGTDSTSARTIWRAYADPTITTNGTALTIVNTHIKTSPEASLMEAYKLPTISVNGQILNMKINPADASSSGINRYYRVSPGHNLLITVENSVSNAKTFTDIYWLEVP